MNVNEALEDCLDKAYEMITYYFEHHERTKDLPAERREVLIEEAKAAYREVWERQITMVNEWDALISAALDGPTRPIRDEPCETVRAIVDIGDQTWVQPLAIVEHMTTGERYIDPLFPISDIPSDEFCVELTVTEAGLVASGPPHRHRLSVDVDARHFRPLATFKTGLPN